MPKHQSREERQTQILMAALDCFREKGYVNTTIDHIATASRLSKGSVYWYYKTKDHILFQAMDLFGAELESKLTGLSQDKLSPQARLAAAFELFIEFQDVSSGLFHLIVEFWAQSKDRSTVNQTWRDSLEVFRLALLTIVQDGVDSGDFRCPNPDALVWSLMATFDGLGGYATFINNLDLPSILRSYRDILLAGLRIPSN